LLAFGLVIRKAISDLHQNLLLHKRSLPLIKKKEKNPSALHGEKNPVISIKQ